MAGPDSRRIVEMGTFLRGAAPDAWNQFVAAFLIYAADMNQQMMRCDPTMLVKAQGMAIAAAEIAEMLKSAHELHEKNLAAAKQARAQSRAQERSHVSNGF